MTGTFELSPPAKPVWAEPQRRFFDLRCLRRSIFSPPNRLISLPQEIPLNRRPLSYSALLPLISVASTPFPPAWPPSVSTRAAGRNSPTPTSPASIILARRCSTKDRKVFNRGLQGGTLGVVWLIHRLSDLLPDSVPLIYLLAHDRIQHTN